MEISYVFLIDATEDITYVVMSIPEEAPASYYANFVRYYPLSVFKEKLQR